MIACTHLRKPETPCSLKNQLHNRRGDQAPRGTVQPQLVALFPFPGPSIYAHHEKDDVCAANNIEHLQEKVPPHLPVPKRGQPEEVEVAGAEDGNIQDLRDERDALGRLVAVDGPYQDELGDGVGHVAEDAEDVEVESHDYGSMYERLDEWSEAGGERERRRRHQAAVWVSWSLGVEATRLHAL